MTDLDAAWTMSRIDDLLAALENVVGVLMIAAILSALGTAVWMLTW